MRFIMLRMLFRSEVTEPGCLSLAVGSPCICADSCSTDKPFLPQWNFWLGPGIACHCCLIVMQGPGLGASAGLMLKPIVTEKKSMKVGCDFKTTRCCKWSCWACSLTASRRYFEFVRHSRKKRLQWNCLLEAIGFHSPTSYSTNRY